jgi:hypothetical protein
LQLDCNDRGFFESAYSSRIGGGGGGGGGDGGGGGSSTPTQIICGYYHRLQKKGSS